MWREHDVPKGDDDATVLVHDGELTSWADFVLCTCIGHGRMGDVGLAMRGNMVLMRALRSNGIYCLGQHIVVSDPGYRVSSSRYQSGKMWDGEARQSQLKAEAPKVNLLPSKPLMGQPGAACIECTLRPAHKASR